MDESSGNASYRALELICRQQARLSATPRATSELERMASEYKQLADWQERQWLSRVSTAAIAPKRPLD
jgi:hypothetical protein